jgi:hypothetical protein
LLLAACAGVLVWHGPSLRAHERPIGQTTFATRTGRKVGR